MKQVTAILIGAGMRGGYTYASYALQYPAELKIVAVAEPDPERRDKAAREHQIPEKLQFTSYEELLEQEKLADCALVCTMDRMHYEPVVLALKKGYHVLCEKPMSMEEKEIVEMGEMAEKYGRILSICHVLRYSPFFGKIKRLLEDNRVGRVISICHIEQVGYWHQAHSFVRGNWRNAEESSPMILQKCCHDMDILLWLVGSHCTKVSSYGSLSWFKEENAPQGAPLRCLDGCPHREECPFYAPRFYIEQSSDYFRHAVTPEDDRESLMRALADGPYGRCVYHCDNTVVDHQVVNLEFENQTTVSFTMCAFTEQCTREIHIMGTKGELRGNMKDGKITIVDFASGDREEITVHIPPSGHSGSDFSMMKDFVRMVAEERTDGRTSAAVSVESHLMALAAERSRLTGASVDFASYRRELQEKYGKQVTVQTVSERLRK